MSHQIFVNVNEVLGKNSVDEWCDDISSLGIKLETVEQPNSQYGALEWLIPTGIVFLITKPYFETILTEAAKDHYNGIKNVLRKKVYEKYFVNSSEKFVRITSKGAKKDGLFSSTFSIATHVRVEGADLELKLLLREKSTSDEIEEAFTKFAKLISMDERSLLTEILEYHNSALHSIVFWLNPETKKIELLDVIKSSMNREIVSIPLNIDIELA